MKIGFSLKAGINAVDLLEINKYCKHDYALFLRQFYYSKFCHLFQLSHINLSVFSTMEDTYVLVLYAFF